MDYVNSECKLEERKLIDYIQEPYRQNLLSLYEKIQNWESEYNLIVPKFLADPKKLVTYDDLATVFETLRLNQLHLANAYLDLINLYGLYFKEKSD